MKDEGKQTMYVLIGIGLLALFLFGGISLYNYNTSIGNTFQGQFICEAELLGENINHINTKIDKTSDGEISFNIICEDNVGIHYLRYYPTKLEVTNIISN